MTDFEMMKRDPNALFNKFVQMMIDGERLSDTQIVMLEYLRKEKSKVIVANMAATATGSGEIK